MLAAMILGKLLAPLREAGPLAVRLVTGFVFFYHGAHKVGLLGPQPFSEAIKRAIGAAEKVGFHPSEYWGYALAFTELGGGLLLLAGLFTRYAAAALGFIMVIAAWKVHGPNGFALAAGGFEYNLVLLACCVLLMLQGGGWLALDGILWGGERRSR